MIRAMGVVWIVSLVAVVSPLLAGGVSAQVQSIPGPPVVSRLVPAQSTARTEPLQTPAPPAVSRSQSWLLPVAIGLTAGVLVGISYGSRGREGGPPSTGERLRSGAMAGLVIAVPVTVVAAILLGGRET